MNSCLCVWMASWSSSSLTVQCFSIAAASRTNDSQLAVELCHAVIVLGQGAFWDHHKALAPIAGLVLPKLRRQRFHFAVQETPLHRELGQSFQRRQLTMQVSKLPLAWPSLLIPVGLDKGS